MIPISPIHMPNTSATQRAKKKKASDGASFSGYMDAAEEAEAPAAIAPASSIAATNPLLSIQEISDSDLAARKAVRKGHQMLDQLDQLRFALMSGGIPLSMLHDLEDVVAQGRSETSDPRVNDLLDEIELRVAVERTKLELALQRNE